jgi:hypothetical protein
MSKRSIWPIAAGILVTVVFSTLVDAVLHAAGVLPPVPQPMTDAQSLLALSYRVVITVGAAWLTARLAPAEPMKHALALGGIGTIIGAAGAATTWNAGLGPHWYPVAIAVLAVPQCWAGGLLYGRQRRRATG